MIILVQSCLFRHGFISAVGVSLNDCQFHAAASFSMYEKKEILPRSSSPLVLILFYLSSSVMCSASFFLTLPFSIPSFLTRLTPLSFSFQPSLLICPFSKIHNYPESFCLAAPPPLCRPPLICLHASSSPDLVLWPLSFLITHLSILS